MSLQLKKIPARVQEAQGRFTGTIKVDADKGAVVDYGDAANPLTSAIAMAASEAYMAKVTEYNRMKKDLDAFQNNLKKDEQALIQMGQRILASAKGKFGFDSNEVETLGGKRSSERKSPRKKVVNIAA
jgi:hypothetical protein